MIKNSVLLFALAGFISVAACSKGSSPTSPTPIGGGGGGGAVGDIVIRYERPEVAHKNLDNPFSGANNGCVTRENAHFPRLNNAAWTWPGGFQVSAKMVQVSDRVFEYTVKDAPAGSDMAISVFDSCRLPYQDTGEGFSINGVRLKDGAYWARFDHRPGLVPSIMAK